MRERGLSLFSHFCLVVRDLCWQGTHYHATPNNFNIYVKNWERTQDMNSSLVFMIVYFILPQSLFIYLFLYLFVETVQFRSQIAKANRGERRFLGYNSQ